MNWLFWKTLIIHFVNVDLWIWRQVRISNRQVEHTPTLCLLFISTFPSQKWHITTNTPWCHVGYIAILIFWNQYVPHPIVTIASGHNTLGGFTCVSSLQLLCHISCLVHFLVVLETLTSPRSKTPFFPLMVTFGLHLTREYSSSQHCYMLGHCDSY